MPQRKSWWEQKEGAHDVTGKVLNDIVTLRIIILANTL